MLDSTDHACIILALSGLLPQAVPVCACQASRTQKYARHFPVCWSGINVAAALHNQTSLAALQTRRPCTCSIRVSPLVSLTSDRCRASLYSSYNQSNKWRLVRRCRVRVTQLIQFLQPKQQAKVGEAV